MKLMNSSTKQLVDLNKKEINIYNCGPTVYNHIHIGNARPLVVFDVLYRFLLSQGVKVNYVLNITDIDDKIIKKALETNKPELEVSEYYFQEYSKIKSRLNTLEMINPKVSDNIDGIISFIGDLIDKDYAYNVNGDIYFDTSKVKEYGCVSNNNTEDLQIGNRIASVEDKRNPNDFILWKQTKEGIKWNTPWSLGRPGWHTECVYLINKYLGNKIDIHGGGMDLKFPHHENENAQNLAHNDCHLADIWLHIGMININNEKMSKSLNNFILVKDILDTYTYQALRWFFYQTSYSNPLNYSDEIMNNMQQEVNKIEKQLNQAKTNLILNSYNITENQTLLSSDFIDELNKNLNLTNATTVLLKVLKQLNQAIRAKEFDQANELYNIAKNELRVLGIEFEDKFNNETLKLISDYKDAVQQKDFSVADNIREKLINLGVW